MPKIKPAPAAQRRAFRKTLSPDQQPLFDKLAKLIDQPRLELDWYHRVGRLTNKLRSLGEKGYHSSGWFADLGAALGPRQWLFHKAVRFVELYPNQVDLQRLKDRGVEWTRLKLSFPIKDPDKRLALLTKALKEEWSIARFHFEVQRRYTSSRRGLGGRPHDALGKMTPEAALDELLRASRAWVHILHEVWEKRREPFQKKLKQLACARDDAIKTLGELKKACAKVSW